MSTINSLENLKQLQASLKGDMQSLQDKVVVKVSMATCGIASGAKEVFDYFTAELEKRNLNAVVSRAGCMGYCGVEPTIEVTVPGREPVVYGGVDVAKADQIIEKYIKHNELIDGVIPVNYRTIENV